MVFRAVAIARAAAIAGLLAGVAQPAFADARKAYEKAVALDPKNLLIGQNYDLF